MSKYYIHTLLAVFFYTLLINQCQANSRFEYNDQFLGSNVAKATANGDSIIGNSSESSLHSKVLLSGSANLRKSSNNEVVINSRLNISKTTGKVCRGLDDGDNITQTQLINRLTDPCRYDRSERPPCFCVQDEKIVNNSNDRVDVNDSKTCALQVFVRVYLYSLQTLETSDVQFKMHGLLQLKYVDKRLAFENRTRTQMTPILGETQLRKKIWSPHLFLANEQDSNVLGTNEKDVLTSISPDGTVVIKSRIQATLYCWMNLKKFPFDEQRCSTVLESWIFNASQLVLRWEEQSPITYDPKMHLTEYKLQNIWCNETLINADYTDLSHGVFSGQYSALSFTVYLVRETGYYIMDYFLPSIMIVAISWVSFWLQADQTPARTILGTSTMLSFITLASTQEKNLPKVSYIKVSEIWFLVCTLFIFGSLLEFAFVNTIWRRRRALELKKLNSKYILISALATKSKSISEKVLMQTISSDRNGATIEMEKSVPSNIKADDEENSRNGSHENKLSWSTLTPHEVSLYIDRKARFAFPMAFIIFNALFWAFVYSL